jgi:hypothetical protein
LSILNRFGKVQLATGLGGFIPVVTRGRFATVGVCVASRAVVVMGRSRWVGVSSLAYRAVGIVSYVGGRRSRHHHVIGLIV